MNEEEKKAWDMYAAAALQGLLTRYGDSEVRNGDGYIVGFPAEVAARYADALMGERHERFPSDTEGGDT